MSVTNNSKYKHGWNFYYKWDKPNNADQWSSECKTKL